MGSQFALLTLLLVGFGAINAAQPAFAQTSIPSEDLRRRSCDLAIDEAIRTNERVRRSIEPQILDAMGILRENVRKFQETLRPETRDPLRQAAALANQSKVLQQTLSLRLQLEEISQTLASSQANLTRLQAELPVIQSQLNALNQRRERAEDRKSVV